MLKKIWNHFSKRVIYDNRGIWPALAFLANPSFWSGVGSVASAGGGILGGLMGGGKKEKWEPKYLQLPDYPEATGARSSWWDTLQGWGKSGDYGATDMNWDEIFNTAQNKLSRYYWGGVNDPGLAGKMKASAARRNTIVSDAGIASLGQQEALDLSDLFSGLTTQKATYTESARNSWLNSLMNLAGLKPTYMTNAGMSSPSSTYGAGNAIGDVSGGISDLFTQYAKSQQQEEWMNKLMDMYGGNKMPSSSQSSLLSADLGNSSGGTSNLLWQLQNLG